jgi:hypothetical protein
MTACEAAQPRPKSWTIGASDARALIDGHLPKLAAIIRGFEPRPTAAETAAAHAAALKAKGVPRVNEDNLELAILIGNALEPLNQVWFERKTGLKVTDPQCRVVHATYPLHATLDGIVEWQGTRFPWEAKTTGPHTKLQEIIDRAAPQLQAQMICFGAHAAIVSVLWRTPKWEAVIVETNDVLGEEILDRLDLLAVHIDQGTDPPQLPPFPLPRLAWRPLAVTSAPTTETAKEGGHTE